MGDVFLNICLSWFQVIESNNKFSIFFFTNWIIISSLWIVSNNLKLFSLFSEACAQMKRLYWNHILTINNFNNGTFKNLFLLIVLSKIRKYIFAYAYLYILGMCFIHNIEVYTYKVMVTVIIIDTKATNLHSFVVNFPWYYTRYFECSDLWGTLTGQLWRLSF